MAGITGNYFFFFLKVCNSGYFWLMMAVDTPDSPGLMKAGRTSTPGTYCKTGLWLHICSPNQLEVGNGNFKSPFPKGEFRGIINRLFNPPCPPLEKGG